MLAPNHYYNYTITITILERSLTQMSPWSSRYRFDIFSSNQIPQIRLYDILLSHQNCHLTTLNLIPFLYSVQPEENTDVTTDKKWSVVTNIFCAKTWSSQALMIKSQLIIRSTGDHEYLWRFSSYAWLIWHGSIHSDFHFHVYFNQEKCHISSVRLLNMKARCHEHLVKFGIERDRYKFWQTNYVQKLGADYQVNSPWR